MELSPSQQDWLLSSGQLLSEVVPFLQMQHDTMVKVISQSFYQLMRFQSTEVHFGKSERNPWLRLRRAAVCEIL